MLLTNFLPDHCCGGRTRTCDLQVMSLASYQLLHSAIYFFIYCNVISELRVQRYCFFLKHTSNNGDFFIFMQNCCRKLVEYQSDISRVMVLYMACISK